MAKLLDGSKFKHADHVSWRKVENEAVVLDLNTSAYFSLNEVGMLIWEKLGEGVSLKEVKEEVCEEYAVDPKDAQKHLETLINQLLKEKLLVAR